MKTNFLFFILLSAVLLLPTSFSAQSQTKIIIKKDSVTPADKNRHASLRDTREETVIIKKTIRSSESDAGDEQNTYIYEFQEQDDREEQIEKKIRKTEHETDSKKADEKSSNLNIDLKIAGQNVQLAVEASPESPFYIGICDENGKQIFYETIEKGGKYSKTISLEKGNYSLSVNQNKKHTTDKITIR